MARIRTIKPEFWTDERVVTISPLARLVYIGLWNFVDDHGRAQCSPSRLKMQILPAEHSADFHQLLAEISGVGLITIYDVDGTRYLEVNGFIKHQKIDKRAKSKYPDPPIPPTSPQIHSLDQGRDQGAEGIKERISAAPEARVSITDQETELFRRGKEILGHQSGGLVKKLLVSKGGNIALARAALETASTKQDTREYIGAIIRGRDAPDDLRARGDAW